MFGGIVLRRGHLGRLKSPEIVPVIFADLAECVISARGAIAMAGTLSRLERAFGNRPRIIFAYFFTYTTLNYHIVPAFLHRIHASIKEALSVPSIPQHLPFDLTPCLSLH
tara:strand:+ start:461 stop:790 length:330 start_codon:yes stop_codon:yes gene_type:complete